MSEKNWTPEPWRHQCGLGGHEVWADVSATGSMRLAACGHADTFDRANAARIVSCVNACAGIANPSAIPALVEAAKAAYNASPCDVDCEKDDGVWPQVAAALAALQEKPNV